ncbi:hypothetical protein ACWCRD_12720 [Streptomyces sp. NPDC002092]
MDTHVHDHRHLPPQARADTAGLRSDDPVRLTVRPENLLLFEVGGPQGPGRN